MLTNTSRIDCTSAQMLVLRYAGRFDVQLPYDADYGKKLYALEEIIKRLQDNETGTVILTLPDRSFFTIRARININWRVCSMHSPFPTKKSEKTGVLLLT